MDRTTFKKDHQEETISRWSSRSSNILFWSYTIGKGPYKGIIANQEIRKVGLSETHASGNREASTHNDWWKPTDGTSTSKKNQDGQRMMKSENFFRVPNPDDESTVFFLSRWSWSDDFFFRQIFKGGCTHVVATTVCTTVIVQKNTLTCRTHIFLLHSLSAHIRTCSYGCTYTHAFKRHEKQVFVAWVSLFSISPSPFSCFTRLCCSCTVTSRPLLTTTSLTIPSTRSCRSCLS